MAVLPSRLIECLRGCHISVTDDLAHDLVSFLADAAETTSAKKKKTIPAAFQILTPSPPRRTFTTICSYQSALYVIRNIVSLVYLAHITCHFLSDAVR
jgi:hypothetical protein